MTGLCKLGGGLVMAAAINASAGTVDSDIVGGAPTTEGPAVPAILMTDANDNVIAICSGTLVTPTIVLTAAHCVDGTNPSVAGFVVYFGTTVLDEDPGFVFATRATRAAVHPQWNPAAIQNGFDIAVLELAEQPPIAPMPINTKPFAQRDLGQPVALVGWGLTAGGANDQGVKRAVVSRLDDFDSQLLLVGNSQTNVCNGDSGGPAFMERDGQLVVVGVTSFGDASCTSVGVDTRVDAHLDFLAAQGIPVQPDPGSEPPPPGEPPDEPNGGPRTPTGAESGGCASSSPSSSALLLVLGALLATRRRFTNQGARS